MSAEVEPAKLANVEQIRTKFKDLLAKTNKEHPCAEDIKALSDLLSGNKSLELWREVASAGQLAEVTVIENAIAVPALKECWKHRLQVLKKDLGNEGAPLQESVALCLVPKTRTVRLSKRKDQTLNSHERLSILNLVPKEVPVEWMTTSSPL